MNYFRAMPRRSLAAQAINVIAIAQGSSELNISAVVDESQAHAAQRAIQYLEGLDARAVAPTPAAVAALSRAGQSYLWATATTSGSVTLPPRAAATCAQSPPRTEYSSHART